MKYILKTAGEFYSHEDCAKLEKLGFVFEYYDWFANEPWYITTAPVTIEITTLKQLMEFVNRWGSVVINNNGEIIIYDDYLE